jgi:hypothetical protein
MICFLPVTVEPFQFSPAEPVVYELSQYGPEGTKNCICFFTGWVIKFIKDG